MKTLLLLFVSVVLFGEDPKYIVHWTTDEPCYECNTRFAIKCYGDQTDCGVPRKTVDHFQIVKSQEAALRVANHIGGNVVAKDTSMELTVGTSGTLWVSAAPSPAPAKGTLVSIYVARELAIDVEEITTEIQQSPKFETRRTVKLKIVTPLNVK